MPRNISTSIILTSLLLFAGSTVWAKKPLEERRLCNTADKALERIEFLKVQIAKGSDDIDLNVCQAGSTAYELVNVRHVDLYVLDVAGKISGCVREVTLRHKQTAKISTWFVTETCYHG